MARRLLVTYLTITALTLAVVVVPLGRVFADREQSRLTYDIEHDAQAVGSLVEDDLEAGTAPSIDTTLADYRGTGGRIIVVGIDGLSVADSDAPDAPPRDFSTRPEIVAALDGHRSSGTRPSETLGTGLLYVAVPVASGGSVHGAVRITYPTSTVDALIRSTWLRLGLLSAVVLALVAAVGLMFASGVTRPVRRLQRASARLAAGELDVRVDPDDGPPELRDLAETFNTTAEQLAQIIESQRRFVADASHQLRTPLTALRLRLDTLAPHVAEPARPKLDAAIAETNRLGRLVQSLLVLARSDAAAVEPVPVDLTAAVAERVDAWAPVGADQAVRLASECPSDLWVLALAGAVEQILDNLISNALEAVPDNTEILVRADHVGDTVDVHVLDQGPGMDPDTRNHAFERFWQSNLDRSDRSGTGFGLGLAIVAQLAGNSGGSARLEPRRDGVGLDAVVTLQRAAPPPGQSAGPERPDEERNLYPTLTSG
ncbi:MAG: ATP-binding protein [Acidimicrobiales bacterium]